MDYTVPTYSPGRSAESQTLSETPESDDKVEKSPATPEVAPLSCDNCRKRKVKCNRRRPECSLCEKLKHKCVYSSARKRPVRRTKYSDLEERLQNMEKALIESQPVSQNHDGPSRPALVSGSNSQPSYQGDLVISRPQIVDPCFAWNIPEMGLVEPLDDKSSAPSPVLHGNDDPAEFVSVSLPIFSERSVQWIDQLLGDNSFSTMVQGLRRPEGSVGEVLGSSANLLPAHKLAESSVQGFFSTINQEVPLFQEDVMALNLNCHQRGSQTLKTGYLAAINIMMAFQKYQCFPITYKFDTDIYLGNALALLPRLILEGPSSLNVGAVLCISLYFVFGNECRAAANVLGAAIQMMVTAGYNTERKGPDAEGLFQNRLFWQAYILSSDISIYLGKPPAILDSVMFVLPERCPMDSRGNLSFQDGSSFNVIYERIALARIQGKAWSMLYSSKALELPHQQIYDNIIELDHELEVWKSRIPEFTGNEMYDGNEGRLVYLTIIHLRYYQLVISIHSVLFTRNSSPDPHVRKMKASPGIARCVQAARDSVSLLNHFNKYHPFMGLLCPNLAWSCDVLCIHVLQNKHTAEAYQDIARLEKVAKIFEKFAEGYSSKIQSQVANMLYFIAAYGVRISKTVMEQPAEAWYGNNLVQIPPVAPRNPTQAVNVESMHDTGGYPIDFSMPDFSQYQDEGRDFDDAALFATTGLEIDSSSAGSSFFIHIK